MAALELEWAFGINSNVPNCVHLLGANNKTEERIFYPVSNNGVIYNLNTKQQTFLSLHTNIITSSILSSDKELLILGDSGASNNKCLISIWNGFTYKLISQYQLPPNFGIQSLAINTENNLLSAIINESISSQSSNNQHLIIWSLIKKCRNTNSEIDDTTIEFQLLSQQQIENKSDNNNELYHFITINHDASEIITHGNDINNFIFWSVTHNKELKPYYMQSTDNINNIDLTCIGELTASTFFPYNNGPLITATNSGDLIVWKYNENNNNYICEHRIISKIISKITRGSINCVCILNNNNIIALASSNGCVRFYDFEFRVIGWLNYLGDEIKSISFPLNIPKYNDISIATANNEFIVPNLIIGTKNNQIIQVLSNINSEPTHNIIIDTFNTICTSMACHPILPLVAVGNDKGEIQMWNILNKSIFKIITLSQQTNEIITDIIFSPNGEYIVFGTDTNYLRIYSFQTFEEIQSFKTLCKNNGNISNLCFSLNGEWIAFSQSNRISVYRFWYGINDMKKEKSKEWILIGNYASHNKNIIAVHFSYPSGIDDISKRAIPRLFSISNDNLINEYNLHRSSANFGLRLKYTFYLKHGMSIPTCIQFIAGIKLNEENFMTYSLQNDNLNSNDILIPKYNEKYKEYEYIEDRLIIFDDELKLHFYHSPRSIFASDGRPIYTSDTQTGNTNTNRNNNNNNNDDEQKDEHEIEPITFRKTIIGPSFCAPIQKIIPLDNNMKTLLYCTYDQIIGLMESPLNGNPNRYFGCIAHPGNIHGFEIIHNNNAKYLITNGGYDKSMLIWKINNKNINDVKCNEKEENNIFINILNKNEYEQIKNYFTYVQIENQGIISTVPISISNKINIKQVIAIFQAMGCFLTKNDIERISKEIISRFKDNENKIDLNQFIQLFVNYRSIFEISLNELHKSFTNIIGESSTQNHEQLMQILQKKGDKMTRDELIQCFEWLTGYNKKQLNNIMPKNITPQFFTQQILGLNQQSM